MDENLANSGDELREEIDLILESLDDSLKKLEKENEIFIELHISNDRIYSMSSITPKYVRSIYYEILKDYEMAKERVKEGGKE